MQDRNPIATMLAAQAAPVETQAEQQAPVQESTQETPQTESVEQHNETISQSQEDKQVQNSEANTLENTNGDNVSQAQGSENTESEAASEESSGSNWWDDENGGVFDETPNLQVSDDADYSVIGNALGMENASAKDVLGKVTELSKSNLDYEKKLKSLEENSQFANPDLAKANEIARNGGDYATFLGLSQNNWDAVPDDTLIVEGKLRQAFGQDVQAMENYLNEMDPVQKKMQAAEIRQGLKDNDAYQKQEIVKRSEERKRKTIEGIRTTLNSTKELFGLKMTPSMKKDVESSLTSGDFVKDIFHDKNGNPDPVKMVRAAVALKNLNKIVQTARNVTANQTTEKILNEVTNPQINRQGQMVDPKPKQPMSPLDARIQSLKQGGR